MSKADSERLDDLRRRAEDALGDGPAEPEGPVEDPRALGHQLHVHQIELEMQNEELRQAQIDLVRSREKYVDLYEFSPVGLLTLSAKGMVSEANLTAVEMFGFPRVSLLEMGASRLLAGQGFDQAFHDQRRRLLSTQVPQSQELLLRRFDGSEFWALVTMALGPAEAGEPPTIRLAINDISKQKQAEQRAQLHERMGSMGQLAAGLAHDLSNIFTSVICSAELVASSPDVTPEMELDLSAVIEETQRGSRMIRQVLDFGRQSSHLAQPTDLQTMLQRMFAQWKREAPRGVNIAFDVAGSDYAIRADQEQLELALNNIIANAFEAMPSGGELRIHVRKITIPPGETGPFPELRPGPWVSLTFVDTGVGMSRDVVSRVLEPFFTTKDRAVHPGLGLSQTYGIILQHDGHLVVESARNVGTTVTVYLPAQSAAGAMTSEAALESIQGQGEGILIVEDDRRVLQTLTSALTRLGFHVLSAKDGVEALEILEQNLDRIQLVISDVVMPTMGGIELYQQIAQRGYPVKVILMSGYPSGDEMAGLPHSQNWCYVRKPVSMARLARTVRDMLDLPSE